MLILILFAFIAGIVTVLSPCILPLLPIILSSSVDSSGKRRPLGVVTGFVLSFTFFTLFLSTIVRVSGIPAGSLRAFSIIVLAGFGLSLLSPQFQALLEKLFTKLTRFAPQSQTKHGFGGGLVIGLSLGLLWTPCVGPILASVISLALTGSVTTQAFFITLAYSLGTALPMFAIIQAGSTALQKVPWLVQNTSTIQKAFGVLMILTAVGIHYNIDRQFQTYILNTFPNYGTGLTKIEDNDLVRQQLDQQSGSSIKPEDMGKPMSELTLPKGPIAPEIIPGGEWFNLQDDQSSLTLAKLQDQVVLIDFWTYSCINCQRTLPYLRAWHEKYSDQGLVIIGVHAPEFEFEKDPRNVAQAISDFELEYPIIQDNNFATWRAYNNRYWPAKYLIDKDGYIRYTHFGEGKYDETEQNIQQLLIESGSTDAASTSIDNPSYQINSHTPESYLGYARIARFASPELVKKDQLSTYTKPNNLGSNQLAFQGQWLITEEYAQPQAGSQLHLYFEAQEVFLVMNSAQEQSQVRVYVDDQLQYFGDDNDNGIVTVTQDDLYKLVKLDRPGRHTLRLEFLDDSAQLFAFTFG